MSPISTLHPFPWEMTPMNNIAVPTYRDGTTYTRQLEQIRNWLNTVLVPDTNDALASVLAEFQAGLANAEQTVTDNNTGWTVRFDQFMADLANEVATLNSVAVAGMVSTDGNQVRTNIIALITAMQATLQGIITGEYETYVDDTVNGAIDTATTGIESRAGAKLATDLAAATGPIVEDVSALTELTAAQETAISLRKQTIDDVDIETSIVAMRMNGPAGQRLNLPTHIPGNTNGEATHPSVAFRAQGWNGYTYWMGFTPYQGAADSMEDPCVAASNDGVTWVVPPGASNPLDDAPGSPNAYNSDTDIAFGPDGYLYLFWRNLDPAATGAEEKIFYRKSADGRVWGPKTLVAQANQNATRLLSPSFVYENGAWTCWYVDNVAAPDRIMRMRSGGVNPAGWGVATPITYTAGSPYQANKQPWHLGVTKAYGRYHALVNDNAIDQAGAGPQGDLVYMTSRDGIVWESAVNSCIPRVQTGQHDMLYRATLVPAVWRGVFGFRVWYGAFTYGTNPQVWSVFRTFITDGSRSERGTFVESVGATPAGEVPTWKERVITFARPFKDVPDVVVSTSAGFLGPAARNVTTTGFTYAIDNPAAVAANNVTCNWTATEPILS